MSVQENTERVKEERDSFKKQLETSTKVVRELSHLQSECANLQNEKREWTRFVDCFGAELGIDSPHALARLLSDQVDLTHDRDLRMLH
jgi:predicted RNase H-like nuclease (RuvC/YqgF family)